MRSLLISTLVLTACGVEATDGEVYDPLVDASEEVVGDDELNFENGESFTGRSCGTELSDVDIEELESYHRELLGEGWDDAEDTIWDLTTAVVPVIVHRITNGQRGQIAQGMIDDQIDVLNAAYAPVGVQFTLQQVITTNNSTWYNGCSGQAGTTMKDQLHQGNSRTLNIYLCAPNDGTLGYSTFPWDYSRWPRQDGVVILNTTLPGGSERGFNLGDTATHEIGHWLGLYHTFEGGCSQNGDRVSDTAPERSPAYGCPTNRNTCSGGGNDPVTNFMDYTDDSCMNNFTRGQITRMRSMGGTYRR